MFSGRRAGNDRKLAEEAKSDIDDIEDITTQIPDPKGK